MSVFGKRSLAAAAAAVLAAAALFWALRPAKVCWVCDRAFHAGMTARVKTGLTWKKTCCLRCALNYGFNHPGAVKGYRVTEQGTGRDLPAESATYVVGSDMEPCHQMGAERVEPGMEAVPRWDRCVPSAVAFSDPKAAADFQRLHGGRVTTWAQLLQGGKP